MMSRNNNHEKKVFTVCLVGGDGAGKTTIAKKLEQSTALPCKSIYMGISLISSNYSLPTSKLVRWMKIRSYRKSHGSTRQNDDVLSMHDLHYRNVQCSWIWAIARMLNRLMEAIYRNTLAFIFKKQGYIVVFERHLLFETAPGISEPSRKQGITLRRIEHWILDNLFPKPDLVIFLDVPSVLLYERKGEATIEYLESRRKKYHLLGQKLKHFVVIKADRPIDEVYEAVVGQILSFKVHSNGKVDKVSRLTF